MSKFHISKDGVSRQCRAKTPESCKAIRVDAKEHFDTKEDANKAYEAFMRSKEVPKTIKRAPSKNLNKKSETKISKTKVKATPKPATQSNSTEKLRELDRLTSKAAHDSISTHKLFVELVNITLDRTLLKPKTPTQMQKMETAYDERIKSFDNLLEKMKANKTFTPESITEIEDLTHSRKVNSGVARLDYFYSNRNNIKKSRFFHNREQRAEIERNNAAVREEEKNSIENFKGLITDFPEGYSKEQSDEKLNKVREDFPKYAHLVGSVSSNTVNSHKSNTDEADHSGAPDSTPNSSSKKTLKSNSKATPNFEYVAKNPKSSHYFKSISEDENEAFTWGDCGILAEELHQKTGYPVVAVGIKNSVTGDLSWQHMTVKTPEGRFLDVTGIQSESSLKRVWTNHMSISPVEEIVTREIESSSINKHLNKEPGKSEYQNMDPKSTADKVLKELKEVG